MFWTCFWPGWGGAQEGAWERPLGELRTGALLGDKQRHKITEIWQNQQTSHEFLKNAKNTEFAQEEP